MKQSMKDYSDSLRRQSGNTTPGGGVPSDKVRKPGETVAQYIERTGPK